MKNRIVTKLAASAAAVVSATLVGGIIGSGTAQAQVDGGHYVGQSFAYGVIPSIEFNVNIVGNQWQQDAAGLGPQNLTTMPIFPTPDGGTLSLGPDPVSQWFSRYELHKTPTGYYGTIITYGVPVGNIKLTKTPRRANQPQ